MVLTDESVKSWRDSLITYNSIKDLKFNSDFNYDDYFVFSDEYSSSKFYLLESISEVFASKNLLEIESLGFKVYKTTDGIVLEIDEKDNVISTAWTGLFEMVYRDVLGVINVSC